jgi:FlaA1/EpsC-like NDP-sugar epimerase
LCGKREDDVEIVYTGLRKGEKLHEELFYASESAFKTECDKVMRSSGKLMSWPVLQGHLRDLDGLVYSGTDSMIRKKLKEIVPEYAYFEEVPVNLPVADRRPGPESTLRIIATTAAND